MSDGFQIQPYSNIDKEILIEAPYITVLVDYDDVYHEEVAKATEIMVSIMNEHLDEFHARMELARKDFHPDDDEFEEDDSDAGDEGTGM